MALIDITPVMTSNTTPSPYVVSASSVWSNTYQPWKAFMAAEVNDSCWATVEGTTTGWIMIDYSVATRVDSFLIQCRGAMDNVNESIKNFSLHGSNDGLSFDLIKEFSEETSWQNGEIRFFSLESPVSYRYYKVVIGANNGFSRYTTIGLIKFFQNDSTTNSDSSKTSRLYCLPSNTTTQMKNRNHDLRTGLLGFANDPENYGTLWMINNKGKAEIPKAAMANADILFEGSSGVVIGGVVTLTNIISKYQFIYFDVSWDSTTTTSFCVNVDTLISKINMGSSSRHLMLSIHADYYLGLTFNADCKSFYIQTRSINTGNTLGVTKVLGIK